MKATYSDFLTHHTNCNKFANHTTAKSIFEFLSQDDSIILMLESCDAGRPALAPVAKAIEDMVANTIDSDISLDDDFTKRAIGRMVKTILEPFGYVVCEKKNLVKSCGAKKFVSASCYRYAPEIAKPSMRIVKKIEQIEHFEK